MVGFISGVSQSTRPWEGTPHVLEQILHPSPHLLFPSLNILPSSSSPPPPPPHQSPPPTSPLPHLLFTLSPSIPPLIIPFSSSSHLFTAYSSLPFSSSLLLFFSSFIVFPPLLLPSSSHFLLPFYSSPFILFFLPLHRFKLPSSHHYPHILPSFIHYSHWRRRGREEEMGLEEG